MATQQQINFHHKQLDAIYQMLRAKGCKGTEAHPDRISFLNRDRKLEQVREPQISEVVLLGGRRAAGTVKRPMFGIKD